MRITHSDARIPSLRASSLMVTASVTSILLLTLMCGVVCVASSLDYTQQVNQTGGHRSQPDKKIIISVPLESTPYGYKQRIFIGSSEKEFTVMVTLRHSMLWIPSINCTESCRGRAKFDPSNSSSFLRDGRSWTLDNYDGGAQGVLGIDSVKMHGKSPYEPYEDGQLFAPNSTFGMASSTTGREGLEGVDGMLGLASLADKGTASAPFFRQLYENDAIFLQRLLIHLKQYPQASSDAGSIVYGTSSDNINCEDAAFSFNDWTKGSYQFRASLAMGSFETTVYYLIMPELIPFIIGSPAVIAEIAGIAGAKYANGSYVVDCDASIPDLEIREAARPLIIFIKSDNLITKKEDVCVLTVNFHLSIGFGPDMYLGAPLFKEYCIGFDFGYNMFHISHAKRATTVSSTHSPTTTKTRITTLTTSPATTTHRLFTTTSADSSTEKLRLSFFFIVFFIGGR
ncbi:unnamed protein product [Cylicocyclus nassatus]|uniref:Peptidase A1 domain-containing protein n=1 Tax=Cylicocyclus nassatus TaxID=53992 RepID=A0AA36DU88_CYLNA|nr:unnamed protein product [Cylicocyclus nassatus]